MRLLPRSLGYIANEEDLEQADRAMIEACGGRVLGSHDIKGAGLIVRALEYEATRSQCDKIQRLAGSRFHRDSWWHY